MGIIVNKHILNIETNFADLIKTMNLIIPSTKKKNLFI